MWTIRRATETDAERMIAYVRALTDVPEAENNILLERGEFKFTPEEEREYLRGVNGKGNSVYLLVVTEIKGQEQVIGSAEWRGGERRATRHVANLGISLLPEWRGKGLGRELLNRMMQWARENSELKRLELGVFARNTAAIRMYEAAGFEHEGRRERAIYRGGEYLDELVMGMWIGE